MDLITANEGEFENIALRHDPTYIGIEELIEVLIEFIQKHKLIIYGGLAIDYALRLHGDKIYPDNLLQVDYDFLSPDHIEHSYDLADIFYAMVKQKYGEDEAAGVRAINATHVKTMRVDIRDNHFLADLSYCPAKIFTQLPTLVYRGIKIIHPDMQRVDIHSSLSFPYDNPPNEVIFARWKKDIKRFHLLAKYYPLTMPKMADIISNISVPMSINKYVLTGFCAYGIMYFLVDQRWGNIPADIIRPTNYEKIGGAKTSASSTNNKESVLLYGDALEIVHFQPEKCISELSLAHIERFYPIINLIPETVLGMAQFGKVKIDVTTGRMLSYVSAELNGRAYRIACAQYLLRQFLAGYQYKKMQNESADVYLAHYLSLLRLMEYEHEQNIKGNVGRGVVNIDKVNTDKVNTENGVVSLPNEHEPITRLSITTYGNENVSLSKEIAVKRVLADIGKAVPEYLPNNYYPSKRRQDLPRPQYDITRNNIFLESGELMDNKTE
jgi:hypothetical protein